MVSIAGTPVNFLTEFCGDGEIGKCQTNKQIRLEFPLTSVLLARDMHGYIRQNLFCFHSRRTWVMKPSARAGGKRRDFCGDYRVRGAGGVSL